MKYLKINGTDLEVSALCMGTVNFGSSDSIEKSFDIMDKFVSLGGNFVDTANIYADWVPNAEKSASEKTIGKWLSERNKCDEVVVATKGGTFAPGTLTPMLSKSQLDLQIETSRKNLNLDTIPLYYLHRDDRSRSVEEIMNALFENIESGKIKYIGCSNWREDRISEGNIYAKKCGKSGFVAVSNRWSLAKCNEGSGGDTSIVDMNSALYNFHKENNIASIPFTATARGYLSKLSESKPISAALDECYGVCENKEILKRAEILAKEKEITVAQIALCFFYSQPFCSIPITSFSNFEQMTEAVNSTDTILTASELKYLTGEV